MARERLLSGIQPTGQMHLGNYLGSVKAWVDNQTRYEPFLMIADLHSLTSTYENPAALRDTKFDLVCDLLALGIDPTQSTLFFQSDVPEHSELHVILSMITPLPWLYRVPSYKSKMDDIQDKDLDTYGFLGYPVLQAADILLYRATRVPVGKDQLPHLELTREIARRFNHFYGNVFPEPLDVLTEFPILPGLDGRKMSKSYGNTLPISDTAEHTQALMMKMFTDPARLRRHDPGHPDVCPVFAYHQIFNKDRVPEIRSGCESAALGCVDCKRECAGKVNDFLAPIRAKRAALTQDRGEIQRMMREGAQKARAVASETLEDVKKAVGL